MTTRQMSDARMIDARAIDAKRLAEMAFLACLLHGSSVALAHRSPRSVPQLAPQLAPPSVPRSVLPALPALPPLGAADPAATRPGCNIVSKPATRECASRATPP